MQQTLKPSQQAFLPEVQEGFETAVTAGGVTGSGLTLQHWRIKGAKVKFKGCVRGKCWSLPTRDLGSDKWVDD